MSHKLHKKHHMNHHHHHEEGPHKVIFDDIDEENIPEIDESKRTLFRKIAGAVIGVSVILMLISYFVLGPHTFDIIESMTSSTKLKGLELDKNGIHVTFTEEGYEKLKTIYLDNQEHEIKLCLLGSAENSRYVVEDVTIPAIYHQSYANVVSAGCTAEAIISMHTHPYRRCSASAQDFKSFESFKALNPEGAMMVMCELDRFYVYR